MAGTLVLTDTFGKTFNDLSAGVYKGTDAVVRATAVFNGPQFTGEQRPFVNASLVQHAAPGSRRGRRRRQRLRVHQADREEREGPGQPGQRRAHAGRQLEPGGRSSTRGTWWPGMPPQAADQVVIDKKSADGRPPPGR